MDLNLNYVINQSDFIKKIFNKNDTSYLTHNFHPWAAKFIPQIPRFFIKQFSEENDIIYDPFCGSGTTLVESLLLRRNSIGNDINYIASLISKAKTKALNPEQLEQIKNWRSKIIILKQLFTSNIGLQRFININSNLNIEDYTSEVLFDNIFHWFDKNILNALLHIKKKIELFEDNDIRDFLLTAFSSIIVRVSKQESETRYAAIEKNVDLNNVFDFFLKKLDDMLERMRDFYSKVQKENWVKVFQEDSRKSNLIEEESVQLILTSPPYANTYDYYLYHKLRMYLLNYDVELVRENEIGSRNRHSSHKLSINDFINEMILCFKNFHKILKPEGTFIIIIGDSIIAKEHISGLDIIKLVSEQTDFSIIQSFCYNLDDVSRLFNKKFRNSNKNEWVIVLKK